MASNQAFSANPGVYTVLSKLGEGGCGDVYKVKDKSGNVYAVKIVDLPKLSKGENPKTKREIRETALNEVKSMKSLASNKNVVQLYDHFLGDDDVFHVSMELCSEGSLKDALDRKREAGQWFDEAVLISWLVQLVSVLKYCHNNRLLHRDIKAENIFLAAGGRTVKLGDFGIAKVLNTSMNHAQTLVGTVPYMPPELFNKGVYNYKSEVWALGCVMYQLMAQKLPYLAPYPGMIIGGIVSPNPVEALPSTRYSAKLRDFVVSKMLSKQEDGRPNMVDILGESFVLEGIANMASSPADTSAPKTASDKKSELPTSSGVVDVASILNASETGDLRTLRRILKTAPPDKLLERSTWRKSTENGDGETPLHRAAWKNQLSAMELLWPLMGEKLGLVDDAYGVTPVARAAASNSINVVEFLLRKDKSYLEKKVGKAGRTILHVAAGRGHEELCRKLVQDFGADMFARSNAVDDGDMPIHAAAYGGHLAVMKLFVAAKPTTALQKNGKGDLAIHVGAATGRTDVVDYFLSEKRQLAEAAGFRGRTILHIAAMKGHVALCQKLVSQCGTDLLFAKSGAEDVNDLPIHVAAVTGRLPVVKYFVSVRPGLELERNGENDVAMHKAALGGQTEVIDFFLTERGLSVGLRGYNGRTILHQAAVKGYVKLCERLVSRRGADLLAKSDAEDDEELPIHLAALTGILEVVKCFVAVKPGIETQKNGDGDLPIHKAAVSGQTAVVEFFLKERGQSVELRGYKGRTVLQFAAVRGHAELCRKLVGQYGADIKAKSTEEGGQTALHYAAFAGRLTTVKYFVTAKPGIEWVKNGEGDMAINKAALAGETDVVEYFLRERHQSAETRSSKGRNPLHQAALRGHLELCKKLVNNYSADVFAQTNAGDDAETPMHLAALAGKLLVVKFFATVKPGTVTRRNGVRDLAIHNAAMKGHTDIVEFFLKECGLSVEARGAHERTVLHLAAGKGHDKLCEKLVSQYNADMFAKSSSSDDEDMPIHLAAWAGHLAVVALFVKKNRLQLHATNGDSKTPLSRATDAVRAGNVAAILVGAYLSTQ